MNSSKKSTLFDFPKFEYIHRKINLDVIRTHIHFFTESQFSSFELLLYLLSFTGTAKVIISSFSLSDTSIRIYKNAIDEGYIESLDLILNTAVKFNKLDLLVFSGNIANRTCLANTHMKLILIENDSWKIVVNQSANASVNNSEESGVICTDASVYDFYKQNLERIFSQNPVI